MRILELGHLLGLGTLSTADCRALHNWFYWNGPFTSNGGDAAVQQGSTWVHGVTIVLALRRGISITSAWNLLCTEQGGCGDNLPVMVACVSDLESAIFAQTKSAGDAGLQQWGLDVGPHQDLWDPYNSAAGMETWTDNSTSRRLRKREKVCEGLSWYGSTINSFSGGEWVQSSRQLATTQLS